MLESMCRNSVPKISVGESMSEVDGHECRSVGVGTRKKSVLPSSCDFQTSSNSNFYCFYGVNGLFLDYFIKGCAVRKCVFSEISHFFIVL